MKFIIIVLLLFLTSCQVSEPEVDIEERIGKIEEKSVESAARRTIQAQAAYYLNNGRFANSLDLLGIDESSEYYSLSIEKANTEQTIIESSPIDKEKGILYFIGVMNIQPENEFVILCEADKPYSEINSIEKLLERDCYVAQES